MSIQIQLQNAIKLAQQGKFSEAIAIFENVIASGVKDFKLFKTLGSLYQSDQQLNKAVSNFKESLKLNPQQVDVNFSLGKIAQSEYKHQDAITFFKNALALQANLAPICLNLAFSYQAIDEISQAVLSFEQTLAIVPKNIDALLGLASCYKAQNIYQKTEELLKKALEIQPQNFKALFNLAVNLDDQNKIEQAIETYHKAISIKPDFAEAFENIGLCYLKLQKSEQALTQFEKGLDIAPYHASLHNMCSSLRFELNHPDFLGRFKSLNKQKTPVKIYEEFIRRLIASKQFEQASDEIKNLKKQHGESVNAKQLALAILSEQKNHQQIIDEIQADQKNSSLFNVALARSYLAIGQSELALKIFKQQVKEFPTDQYLWGMYSTALRITDPESYAMLCDYNNLIFTAELDYPKSYGTLANFNEALLTAIEKVHCTDINPLEQSLVGGTQTPGFLFNQPDAIFAELKTALYSTIHGLLQSASLNKPKFPANHPTWSRWSDDFEFNTAWSVWLHSSGFHKSHIHSKGWYSSAYYVSVPDNINNDSHAGYLNFGDIPFDVKEKLSIEKLIKPEAGKLALFPSFVWHGTVPFENKQPRVSVAFDLLPK